MVLFGLDPLIVTYREVNAYEHLLDAAVVHDADQLSIEQLHEMAWPLVEQRLRKDRAQVIDRYHSLSNTGRVSSDLEEVFQAATEGRVETLFIKADPGAGKRSPAMIPRSWNSGTTRAMPRVSRWTWPLWRR